MFGLSEIRGIAVQGTSLSDAVSWEDMEEVSDSRLCFRSRRRFCQETPGYTNNRAVGNALIVKVSHI